MTFKPIDPDTHGAIDYGFFATIVAAPRLFELEGSARKICYGLAAIQSAPIPFTDYKYSIRRVVPFKVHGRMETVLVPSLLLLPWLAGALRRRNARAFFGTYFAAAAVNYLLTDWNANERESPSQRQRAHRG